MGWGVIRGKRSPQPKFSVKHPNNLLPVCVVAVLTKIAVLSRVATFVKVGFLLKVRVWLKVAVLPKMYFSPEAAVSLKVAF